MICYWKRKNDTNIEIWMEQKSNSTYLPNKKYDFPKVRNRTDMCKRFCASIFRRWYSPAHIQWHSCKCHPSLKKLVIFIAIVTKTQKSVLDSKVDILNSLILQFRTPFGSNACWWSALHWHVFNWGWHSALGLAQSGLTPSLHNPKRAGVVENRLEKSVLIRRWWMNEWIMTHGCRKTVHSDSEPDHYHTDIFPRRNFRQYTTVRQSRTPFPKLGAIRNGSKSALAD